MKATVPLFSALGALAASSADAWADSSIRDSAKQLLAVEFRYDPTLREADEPGSEADQEVVVMETFTVTESYLRRSMARTIDERRQRLEAEKFTWTKGGTFLDKEVGAFRVKLGSWPQGAFIPLLKIEW